MKEYAQYKQKVDDFFQTEGIDNLSQITDSDGDCESYFSHSACECCKSHLGGDRYDCNGYNTKTKKVYEYSVCTDCVYFAEYGELPGEKKMKKKKDDWFDDHFIVMGNDAKLNKAVKDKIKEEMSKETKENEEKKP